ncbi:MAG: hypothetical protein EHM39_10025, partial [Chloroflexi bacterium]
MEETVQQTAAQQNTAEHQARLAVEGQVTAAGAFEVMAITAGDGNGWTFGEDTLRESLSLWDGAECFVDHAWFSRSVRDLAGVLYEPTWDADKKGVRCKLRTLGASGPILSELGKQMLAEGEARPRIGFSADVVFTALSRKVQKILRVNAVDLVFNPARGGAFLRALNSVGMEGWQGMADKVEGSAAAQQPGQAAQPAAGSTVLQAQLSSDLAAVQTLLNVQRDQQRLAEEAEAARAVRAQMCGYLLDTGLAAARLPQPVAERIRKQFAGKV